MKPANHKRKKLYYLPGLISLAIAPFIFSFLEVQTFKKSSPRVMPVNMFSHDTAPWLSFDKWYQPRDYLAITLTGNEDENKTKMDFIQLETRRILHEQDSIHGILIQFNNGAPYHLLVDVFDIMEIENAKAYLYMDQKFWFFYEEVYE